MMVSLICNIQVNYPKKSKFHSASEAIQPVKMEILTQKVIQLTSADQYTETHLFI
mgnify:CR=1|jgi:hypothetical protein